MSHRSLLITALLGAFALVLVGGVVSRFWSQPAPVDPPVAAQAEAALPAAPAAEPTTDFAAREQAYRERIEEANRRLVRQQAALDEARRQLEQAPPSVPVQQVEHEEEEHEDDDDDEEHEHARWARADHHDGDDDHDDD